MSFSSQRKIVHKKEEEILFLGVFLFLLSLTTSLLAYYLFSHWIREVAFGMFFVSMGLLFYAMQRDIHKHTSSAWISWGFIGTLILFYIMQRLQLPRFDFSVGDPSDYFLAGVCSVTYNQDIGFFLPLTASISALGYDIIGIAYAPFINVIVYSASIPLIYFLFKKLTLSTAIALLLSVFFTFIPLTIWFSKTSFSEPLWQILILILFFSAYHIMQTKHLSWKILSILYLLLFLVPFLRGEGVIYFGLILFLMFYHSWKYSSIQSSLLLAVGLFVLSASIHLTLQIRGDYLLNMQFSRIIPHITQWQLMRILYGASTLSVVVLLLLSRIKIFYSKLPFSLMLVIFSIVFKMVSAYYFSLHKDVPFEDLLFLNEYGFALGNFGLPLTVLIYIGLVLLYLSAAKRNTLSLILVVSYTLFSIPFMMQNVHFDDVHAFFLYWNRYYFSVLMLIHLFALSLSLKAIYALSYTYTQQTRFTPYILRVFFILVIAVSMNSRIYHIVISEGHQQGSYKLYEWLKKNVKQDPILVVMDKDVLYKQNKEHIGRNDLKYLVSRAFSIYKINVKHYQRVKSTQLTPALHYALDIATVKHVLCLSVTPCKLGNKELIEEKKLFLPLSWRQHFGLDTNASTIHHGDIGKSVVKHLPLYATLYAVKPQLKLGKTYSFKHQSIANTSLFKKGWTTLQGSGMLAHKTDAILALSAIDSHPYTDYTLTLGYAIMDAKQNTPKTVLFTHDGNIIKEEHVHSPYTRTLTLHLPKSDNKKNDLAIRTVPQGYFVLRTLKMSKITKQ